MIARAARLRQAREQAGYETPTDAARAMGIVESTYLGHENTHRGFSLATGARYARFFRASFEWLMLGEQPYPRDQEIAELIAQIDPDAWEEILPLMKTLLRLALHKQSNSKPS